MLWGCFCPAPRRLLPTIVVINVGPHVLFRPREIRGCFVACGLINVEYHTVRRLTLRTTNLGHKQEYGNEGQSTGDADKPESELPRQILDDVAIYEWPTTIAAKSVFSLCSRQRYTVISHSVVPPIWAKFQIIEREPRSCTLDKRRERNPQKVW